MSNKIDIVRSVLKTLWVIRDDLVYMEEGAFEKILQARKDLETLLDMIKKDEEEDEEEEPEDFIYSPCKKCGFRVGAHSVKESKKCGLM